MTIQVIIADQEQHALQIRELFWEYLQWANARVNEEFKVSFDISTMLEGDMQDLGKFMPPSGRLLLGYVGNDLAGIACLRLLTPGIGEIKRMYVRPGHRKAGLGQTLLTRLLQEAQHIGYEIVRLDSARFMKEAHRLYRSSGFKEITAYAGSEIPKEFQDHWVFMEMTVVTKNIIPANTAPLRGMLRDVQPKAGLIKMALPRSAYAPQTPAVGFLQGKR